MKPASGLKSLLALLVAAGAAPPAEAQLGSAPAPAIARQPQLSFGLGPFRVAPYLRVGEIALDTNVFYTQDQRRTDLYTGGGPGLRITLPIRRVTLYADGNAHYYWFARTVSERKLGGQAAGGIDAGFGPIRIGASRGFTRSYDRPSVEVDRRVLRDEWRNRFYLSFAEEAGMRLRLNPSVITERTDVAGTEYFGTDLGRTLTQDRIAALLELRYRLTSKTDLLLVGDQEWIRFPKDHSRDAESNRVGGGLSVSSETRIGGRIVGGVRFIRPKALDRFRVRPQPFADATLQWRLGAKTLFAVDYRMDTYYSAFDSVDRRLPTVRMQFIGLRFNRRLLRRMDLDLRGGLTTFANDAPVVVLTGDGTETLVRDDQAYFGSADLGWNLFDHLRIGAVVTYRERFSNFRDFGVEGLLAGASLRFNP